MTAKPTDDRRHGMLGGVVRALALLAVLGFVALLAYGLTAQAPDGTIDDALTRSEAVKAPDFELDVLEAGRPPDALRSVVERSVADGTISSSELRGTPVVLNFWASWCQPCQAEAPVLERGWRRAGGQGVLFLGVDVQDLKGDAREFLRTFDVGYPNVRDPGNELAPRFGATGLPETYFISARGDVVGHVIGTLSSRQLDQGVAAARAGRPAQLGSGGDRRPTR